MSLIDDAGRRIIEPGDFEISIGGKQPGSKGNADAKTTGTLVGKFTLTGKVIVIPEK